MAGYKLTTLSAALFSGASVLVLGVTVVAVTGTPALAGCTSNAPASGTNVVCDGSAPNPDTFGVQGPAANDVTVSTTGDSVILITGGGSDGVALGDRATIDHVGEIVKLGAGDGISVGENSSVTVGNGGSVVAFGGPSTVSGIGIRMGSGTTDISGLVFSFDDDAILISNGGSLIVRNGGFLDAGNDGVAFDNGGTLTVFEGGEISAFGDGITVNGGTGTVTNAGSIFAGENGVDFNAGGTVTNSASGIIEGDANGVSIEGATGTVTNSGFIGGIFVDGVSLESGGAVANLVGGEIFGGFGGVFVTGGTGRVTNAGLIRSFGFDGVFLANGGTVVNLPGGEIFGADQGISIEGSSGLIINSGRVQGFGGDGIDIDAGGTVINLAGGEIFGVEDGIDFENAGGSVVNMAGGRITGSQSGISVRGGIGDVVNGGMVIGGTGPAILFDGFDDRLEIRPGSVISGDVRAGAGIDSFVLGGSGSDTFDVGLLDGNGVDNGEQYRGFESFGKQGSSIWTLTGTNSEVGAFLVSAGELKANAAMPNTEFTVGDATLNGIGTIGSLIANNRAWIAPGGPRGTLNVIGNTAFNTGSTYVTEIGPAANADVLNVGNTVEIVGTGSTISAVFSPLAMPNAGPFTVITAGTVRGQFGAVTDNLPDLDLEAIYSPTTVQLGFTAPTAGTAVSDKTNGAAGVAGAGMASHNFAELLATRAAGRAAIVQPDETSLLAFEQTADGSRFALASDAVDAVFGSRGGELDGSQTVWSAPFGDWTSFDATGGATPYDSKLWGLAAGVERTINDVTGATIVGLAVGYSRTELNNADGEVGVDTGHMGLYGAYNHGQLTASGALSLGVSDYNLERVIRFGGNNLAAGASTGGWTIGVYGEIFYDFTPSIASDTAATDVQLGPVARIRGYHARHRGYAESGAGILNITAAPASGSVLIAGIGARATGRLETSDLILMPSAELLYEHSLGDEQISASAQIPFANAAFSTAVQPADEHMLSVGLGLGAQLGSGRSVEASYKGTFGETIKQHRGFLSLSVPF